jgi:hypothetical protein
MPPHLTVAVDLSACYTVTLKTLEILAHTFNTPFLVIISTTAQSLVENFEVNPAIKTRYYRDSQVVIPGS